jgi:putative ABC transport system permease protein
VASSCVQIGPSNGPPERDARLIARHNADSADSGAVESSITDALHRFPAINVENTSEYKRTISDQLNQIIYLLYALLAMSVVISLFGIANSLFLSIHERTGELGVPRAVGATTTQIKRVIRYESVITAVIGGVLGTAIGVLFAWLLIRSLSELGFGLSVPVGQLAIFVGLAVAVGVVGAIAPPRRAARVDILAAIHHE